MYFYLQIMLLKSINQRLLVNRSEVMNIWHMIDSILIQKMNSLIIVSGITGFISAYKQRWHTMSYHIINLDGSIKSVCVCLVTKSCLTLCDPMETAACQASLSFTVSQSLFKLMSTVCVHTYIKHIWKTFFLYPLALWNFL